MRFTLFFAVSLFLSALPLTVRAAEEPSHDLQEILNLAGWDAERLDTFHDGQPLSAEEIASLLPLLMRIKSFDDESIARWTANDERLEDLRASPQDHRGQMIHFSGGRVRQILRHELAPQDAQRFGFPAYFECEVELSSGEPMAVVLTPHVPHDWMELESLDEPVEVAGMFIALTPADGDPNVPLLLSKRIGWRPERAHEPYVHFGETVLAGLGVDVAPLGDVVNRQPILPQEREAFYQILAAMGKTPPQELVRIADGNLPAWKVRWQDERDRLATADGPNQNRRLLAETVLKEAAEGAYSVAPLFNDSDVQIGSLIMVDGVARRAVRVDVGTSADGQPSDVQRRFGISDYFELEVFTDDSQNLPLVFCVRKLPVGFPTGDNIREPVRIAGFFFKTWRYRTRKSADGVNGSTVAQVAPLLISSGPLPLRLLQANSFMTQVVAGAFILLMLAGIFLLLWRSSHSDRKFERETLQKFREPTGGVKFDEQTR